MTKLKIEDSSLLNGQIATKNNLHKQTMDSCSAGFCKVINYKAIQINKSYYLSSRTTVPITIPASRINPPEEITIGTANPISRVASLSGLGNRAGVRVASRKPSEQKYLKLVESKSYNLVKNMVKSHIGPAKVVVNINSHANAGGTNQARAK